MCAFWQDAVQICTHEKQSAWFCLAFQKVLSQNAPSQVWWLSGLHELIRCIEGDLNKLRIIKAAWGLLYMQMNSGKSARQISDTVWNTTAVTLKHWFGESFSIGHSHGPKSSINSADCLWSRNRSSSAYEHCSVQIDFHAISTTTVLPELSMLPSSLLCYPQYLNMHLY